MDTPNMLRGEFYPTHLTARCSSFKQCPLCKMCENYCRHSAQCVTCENRKRPVQTCTCTDRQKEGVIKIQERLRRPLFDPNAKSNGTLKIADVSQMEDWDNLVESLNFLPKETK